MRKFLKNNILEVFKTIYEAHEIIRNFIKDNNYENAKTVIIDCQNSALQIGKIIENSEGEGFVTVGILEEYCKYVYQIFMSISDECNGKEIKEELDKRLNKVEKSVKDDIKVKLEIVFFPYKASMWDSLESVWKAADEDPDCDAYVVPIPYYDRNPDHSFGQFHYEGYEYPDYVPITDYRKYDMKNRRPDVIYIHNPYDSCNYVTSVHPDYYTSELKKYTDMLVYVPYFVVDKINQNVLNMFCSSPCIDNVDHIIIQYEELQQSCIKLLSERTNSKVNLEQKFLVMGSPKIDAIVNLKRENYILPEEWNSIINGRKIIFYNITISTLLTNTYSLLNKLKCDFETFHNNKEMVLWWRPHPLIQATIASMRPEIQEEYKHIVEDYINKKIGIYDDTPDLHRAIACSDIYYGSTRSSVYKLYSATGKPTIFMGMDYNESDVSYEHDYKNHFKDNSDLKFLYINANCDGTSGKKIHKFMRSEVSK